MNDLTVVYYTDIHCIIDIKKEIEMTNYETLQQICERAKENIDIFNEHETIAALESIITDNLGTLSEIQQLLSPEGVN